MGRRDVAGGLLYAVSRGLASGLVAPCFGCAVPYFFGEAIMHANCPFLVWRDTARYGEIWRDMAIFFHIWPPRVQSSTPPHRRCSCRHVWLAYWPIPCTCARHRPPTLNITHPTASLPPSMGRRHTAARQALGGAVALFRAWYVCRFTTCGECSRGVW